MGINNATAGSKANEKLRVNERIRAREVRVIDSAGQQIGIMPPELAIQKAMDLGLDLVEVSGDAQPPVCRIMDYGKFKYTQKKKDATARKNQAHVTVKEVKFRPKIDSHDYSFKVERIKRFLSEGHKAKVTMMFRGREITRQELAKGVMDRIMVDIRETGVVEQHPRLDGRNMTMVLAPPGK